MFAAFWVEGPPVTVEEHRPLIYVDESGALALCESREALIRDAEAQEEDCRAFEEERSLRRRQRVLRKFIHASQRLNNASIVLASDGEIPSFFAYIDALQRQRYFVAPALHVVGDWLAVALEAVAEGIEESVLNTFLRTTRALAARWVGAVTATRSAIPTQLARLANAVAPHAPPGLLTRSRDLALGC